MDAMLGPLLWPFIVTAIVGALLGLLKGRDYVRTHNSGLSPIGGLIFATVAAIGWFMGWGLCYAAEAHYNVLAAGILPQEFARQFPLVLSYGIAGIGFGILAGFSTAYFGRLFHYSLTH